ncbi:DUF397 domain-containing protein [Streptomyces poonensis]|uniref:DUF397 domain-containing protein n=1 Tax=Streptomyces poonensis TaxID=68255 RepID=A0A918PJR3_9ACTN|nr:DUF397 domain-containing protein [Streptomyces poonensis]GGZ11919.1 hypothetical protein GCM10010365_34650 [Streptomyces poonensis]GLJ92620.1 hypothetical protein GCM10017589_52300 [Streptomyces poonensis]
MRDFQYQKSSYSDPQRECVEIATNIPGTVAIRDSKNPTGPFIQVRPATWSAFQRSLLAGRPNT